MEEKITDVIERELLEITEIYDDFKNDVAQKTDVVLGEMTERDKILWSLARKYRQQAKQVKATQIMLDDDNVDEAIALHSREMFFNQKAELIRDIMWMEIRIRYKGELQSIKNSGIGVRKGFKIVTGDHKSNPPEILGKIFGFEVEL